jgi:hypothetical protein
MVFFGPVLQKSRLFFEFLDKNEPAAMPRAVWFLKFQL